MTHRQYTLSEAAEITGRSVSTLRQHIVRGRLIAEKDGNRTLIPSDRLDAYMSAETLIAAVPMVRISTNVPKEIGNMIERLPPKVIEAILEGLPTSKKAGSGTAFRAISETLPHQGLPVESEDPHWGFSVGHQHVDAPKWKRMSANTWSLGDGRWSWNGIGWEGGGSREGVILEEGMSPASPFADQRPLAPSEAVKK